MSDTQITQEKKKRGIPRKILAQDQVFAPETEAVVDSTDFLEEEGSPRFEAQSADQTDPQIIKLKSLVSSFYDMQKLRMAVGGRLFASVSSTLGFTPGTKVYASEEEDTKEQTKLLVELKSEYTRITKSLVSALITPEDEVTLGKLGVDVADAIPESTKFSNRLRKLLEEQQGTGSRVLIENQTMYQLVKTYVQLIAMEGKLQKQFAVILQNFPIYTQFLSRIKGCGPVMSACILAKVRIEKAHTVSSLNKFCGLDVAPDGRGRGKYKVHMEERTYTDKSGEEQVKMSLTYDPWLKTKVMGVLASSFMIHNEVYREEYWWYRKKIEHRNSMLADDDPTKLTLGHINKMAIRWMAKSFIQDLWFHWRAIAGHKINEPYSQREYGTDAFLRTFAQTETDKEEFVKIKWNDHLDKQYFSSTISTYTPETGARSIHE